MVRQYILWGMTLAAKWQKCELVNNRLEQLVQNLSEDNVWHAAHIVPVADGGRDSFLPLKKLARV